jgi:hypothetical protein
VRRAVGLQRAHVSTLSPAGTPRRWKKRTMRLFSVRRTTVRLVQCFQRTGHLQVGQLSADAITA